MDRSDLHAWLDRYVEAWRDNKPEAIEALFTEDAVYRFHPYDAEGEIAVGRAGIVEAWLEAPDDPNTWAARYEAFAMDDDRGVARGTSRYLATADEPERVYYNCFLMRFGVDGKCAEFTEYFMRLPD